MYIRFVACQTVLTFHVDIKVDTRKLCPSLTFILLMRITAIMGGVTIKGEDNATIGATYRGPYKQYSRKCAGVVMRRPDRVVVGCWSIIFPT
jgi:hypothetical protein